MNSCDFFLWGYLKGSVYRINPDTVQEMQAEIKAAAEQITGDMFCDIAVNSVVHLQ
jgi:hypothetical protein